MLTDRELLELAAKAAGHLIDPIDAMHEPDDWACWNPLTDDGDALRLAAGVGIDMAFYEDRVETWKAGLLECMVELYEGDRLAATRRAIVRAAAEIGRR